MSEKGEAMKRSLYMPRHNYLPVVSRQNFASSLLPVSTTIFSDKPNLINMSDCNYLTLFYSKDGYVVKCIHCSKIQMAFGNVILNLSTREFQEMRLKTIDKIRENKFPAFPEQKNITYNTDSDNIRLVFSFRDLEVFYEMLQQANLMLEVNNILLNQN